MNKQSNLFPSIPKAVIIIFLAFGAEFVFLNLATAQTATTLNTPMNSVDWHDFKIWIGVFISSVVGIIIRFWTENNMHPSFDMGIAYAFVNVATLIIGAIIACLIFPYFEVRLILLLAYLVGWGIVSSLASSILYGKEQKNN